MVGAMVHVITDPARLLKLSDGLCDPGDVAGTIARLKQFLCAGLDAPATPDTEPTDAKAHSSQP
jgi:hypothetical protein